ncbi:inositol monophosphatase family protein [Solwaraspora sp. WMMD406]|uniref:inositol monophosphatase family protein n=1 Tax=Solwaraspora sp. WMMD406 TaxID=3016095 RepID=UPI002416EBFA|nr:inositol monophosphatase family protein [Solwaraspora sp. WMMD406]MDG4767686.1 inositol monophosphatase family protein [Solwaraspora sp. WMMD406]
MIDTYTAELVRFAEQLADESNQLLAAAPTTARPDSKADNSFVTEVDRAIETRLRELISDAYPGHGILGEEYGGVDVDADVTWIVDPVDGTAHLVAGIPLYGTLIGVSRHGRPWIGVLDYPATGDRWVGVNGSFARRNGQPVRTRPCADLPIALVTCSNPDFFTAEEFEAFTRVRRATRYAMYGASSFAYALLASGRTDLVVDAGLQPYDLFAPAAVIGGAGGLLTDWSGADLRLTSPGQVLAAGDGRLHAEALRMLK